MRPICSRLFRQLRSKVLILPLISLALAAELPAQAQTDLAVIAYYAGDGQDLDRYRWEQITHVIFSFCHLKGDELAVDNARDSTAIRNLVHLKETFPHLKVLLSLGGWGGCETCSEVFSRASGIAQFARSVKRLTDQYGTDGLDLDWEYPAIAGYPGHLFAPTDRAHFTRLVQELRQVLGPEAVVSFAAGGFQDYFDHSVDWVAVLPYIDFVNLMSYDLVGGYSTVTGHHTPLYSNDQQEGSANFGVRYLLNLGVPARKIVLGAAFYARSWEKVAPDQNGLYQTGAFKSFIPHHRFDAVLTSENGFVYYRDSISRAPYAYSASRREFATFDDAQSLAEKTRYALEFNLGGIMFWQLTDDRMDGSLLQAIWEAKTGD
ncbi:glycosyl hydrolase family 18 protein [Robiginitalea sp. M366]|uniref:glycoside hydrolase family 18 protein n=1 Tax=Robiginitalea aestuariiviva TaxID=3036903 RepID=UPI00240DB58D|nr:glycosyl hydrolase family 18 protein [Robiginitalea aestuariiviva]MDG1572004.1 glycosyl hydrolase family 18 protein [Robiginitalea aestuariiviva]